MKKLLVAVLATLSAIATANEEMYVQTAKAKIYEQPYFNATVLTSLAKSAKVSVVKKQGDWYQVTTNDHAGWASALVLAVQPPLSKVSVFTGQEENIKESARRRATTVATAGAIRGLTNEDRQRADEDAAGNFRALRHLETIRIDAKDLEAFAAPLEKQTP